MAHLQDRARLVGDDTQQRLVCYMAERWPELLETNSALARLLESWGRQGIEGSGSVSQHVMAVSERLFDHRRVARSPWARERSPVHFQDLTYLLEMRGQGAEPSLDHLLETKFQPDFCRAVREFYLPYYGFANSVAGRADYMSRFLLDVTGTYRNRPIVLAGALLNMLELAWSFPREFSNEAQVLIEIAHECPPLCEGARWDALQTLRERVRGCKI